MGEYFSDPEEQVAKHSREIQEEDTSENAKIEFTLWNDRPPPSIPDPSHFHDISTPIPAYFWGDSHGNGHPLFPTHEGYIEARRLIGTGNTQHLEQLATKAIDHLTNIFSTLKNDNSKNQQSCTTRRHLTALRLSSSLQKWKATQHAQGRVLPPKGHGLRPVSLEARRFLGAENWPAPLITRAALFGCGTMNLLQGAYDAPTLMANYLSDLGFFLEHGYHKVFPRFEDLLKTPPHKFPRLGEENRRAAAEIGLGYIRAKVHLEETFHARIGNLSAILPSRETMQTIALFESSLLGVAGEAVARGFDPAGVMADLVFSNPGTDVVDVGRDLHNSEVMNSFLNTADFTSDGVVTEEKLRKVYDAYAHTGARSLVERWSEPTSRVNAQLYTWHILNDRHMFLRLAILGYGMCRGNKDRGMGEFEQREADMDEAFDENLHTTGFSRPLVRGACDGDDYLCDAVRRVAEGGRGNSCAARSAVVYELWRRMVTDILEYAAGGEIDPDREDQLVEDLGRAMAEAYARGYFVEVTWLCSHASHHAWQVNYLFEAAMFGSLLDDGALCGKLDRAH